MFCFRRVAFALRASFGPPGAVCPASPVCSLASGGASPPPLVSHSARRSSPGLVPPAPRPSGAERLSPTAPHFFSAIATTCGAPLRRFPVRQPARVCPPPGRAECLEACDSWRDIFCRYRCERRNARCPGVRPSALPGAPTFAPGPPGPGHDYRPGLRPHAPA